MSISRSHSLVARVGILAVGILFLLELWRPLFFLTDDNLSQHYPVLSEIGRDLVRGGSVTTSEYLFGGGYSLIRDPTFTCCWHPLILLASLLANTPAAPWMMELIAGSQLVLAAMTFAVLTGVMRRRFGIPMGDGMRVFVSLSYAFTAYNVIVGSSWFFYLATQVSLPIYLVAMLVARRRTGILAGGLAVAHALLAGFPSPWLLGLMLASAMALALGWSLRSMEPLRRWAGSVLLGSVLSALVLVPAFLGFLESGRSAALPLEEASAVAPPLDVLLSSLFAGSLTRFTPLDLGPFRIFSVGPDQSHAIATSAACVLVAAAMFSRRRWSRIQVALALLLVPVVLWIVRPLWVSHACAATPFLRSLRWPFREVSLLLFLVHVLVVLRLPPWPRWSKAILAGAGALILLDGLLVAGPPSINPMLVDRGLVLDGTATKFWSRVRPRFSTSAGYVAVGDPDVIFSRWQEVPHALLGSYNYGALFEVRCAGGYSPTRPLVAGPIPRDPFHWGGIYEPKDVPMILRHAPGAALFRLESVCPLRFSLETSAGHREMIAVPELSRATGSSHE